MTIQFTTQMKEALLAGNNSFIKHKRKADRAFLRFDKIVVRRGASTNSLVLELHHGDIPLAYFEAQPCNLNAGDVVTFAHIEGKTSIKVGI